MNSKRVVVRSPSNIAIVKYMGKADLSLNLPENTSISMTLKDLCSVVDLEAAIVSDDEKKAGRIFWEVEPPRIHSFERELHVPRLSEKGIQRMIRFCDFLKKEIPLVLKLFQLKSHSPEQMNLWVRSANTFPTAAGIASSASSFSAVTAAFLHLFAQDEEQLRKTWEESPALRIAVSAISRQGSGSSCRSFEGPWVAWNSVSASPLSSQLPELVDLVLMVDSGEKKVSSSQAHQAVKTSPQWEGRPQRAEQRARRLESAIQDRNFEELARISWEDMLDMHELFHSSQPSFSYWTPKTREILSWFEEERNKGGFIPAVTLDAGPNVHVLLPVDQKEDGLKKIRGRFPDIDIMTDCQGNGVQCIFSE